MTGLRIRIDKYLESDGTRPPLVPAKIYSIDPSAGSSASTRSSHHESIPISHRPEDAIFIKLGAGDYYVETVLPDGEVLSDSFSLTAEQTSELVLRAERSPHEWLSWQSLVGNVSSSAPPAQAKSTRATKTSRSGKKKVTQSREGMRDASRNAAGSASETAVEPTRHAKGALSFEAVASESFERPEVSIGMPIRVVAVKEPASIAIEASSASAWEWLGGLAGDSAANLVATLSQGRPTLDVATFKSDGNQAVYRITLRPSSSAAFHVSSGDDANTSRHFALVPHLRWVELIALPMPWNVIRSGREASIEIVTRQVYEENDFCASATARDEDLGPLLGYLSSGLLPTVRDLAETARDMLFRKWENPYAACAGGYALVGTARAAEDREWHDWIRTLMNRFPDIPDGAIQWAQLRLKTRRTQADIEEARTALKLAYRRGLPFYSMGIRLLTEGLEWLSRDDPEAAEMMKNVRRVAWRTNFQQPFTILRIGGA